MCALVKTMISKGLMVSSVAVLTVAYYLYTPMPPQCKEPWRQRVIVSMSKIICLLSRISEVTGLGSHAAAWRAVFNISTKGSDPQLEIEDVQFDGVPVRLYKRIDRGKKLTGGAIYIHGGGFVFGSKGSTNNNGIQILKEAMGVAQHHDAVTGTEKQAVADDYALRLYRGVNACQTAMRL